jgi:hypothetical protein
MAIRIQTVTAPGGGGYLVSPEVARRIDAFASCHAAIWLMLLELEAPMAVRVQTVTAPSQRELERLVQLEVARGWQRVGTPAEQTFNGRVEKAKWQQAMRRG